MAGANLNNRARLQPDGQGRPDRAIFNLVAPLPHEGTAMHTTDTAASQRDRSGAVSPLSNRLGDVNSANGTPRTLTLPGTRTSTTATRTTTTRTTSSAFGLSADYSFQSARRHADFTWAELVTAYFDCRRTKRNSASALAFEVDLERNLSRLEQDLRSGRYAPGPSICFVITRPKAREVWAADFRDRIVHHLLYNRVAARFHAGFIADSSACIPGRGTLYAVTRMEAKIRSATQNWTRPAHYLKCDLANFFVSIDKHILLDLLQKKIREPWWQALAAAVLFHDPRENYILKGSRDLFSSVPPHKRLENQPAHIGLPIGNLSSQFFANVLLNELDQHVKHDLRVQHYGRYVDDFLCLGDPGRLNEILADLTTWLPANLGVRLNPRKTILQPCARGVDFVGQRIEPFRRRIRKRTRNDALQRIRTMPAEELFTSGQSYFGLFRQASHSHGDRAELANLLRARGHSVDRSLTHTFRRY
jgi:hypothetical protein